MTRPIRNLGMLACLAGQDRKTALADLEAALTVRQYSYSDFERLVASHARRLISRELAQGARVAVLAANSADFLAAFLGIMRAGMVAVPVNYRLPAATVDFILRDCGASLILADSERRQLCPAGLPVEGLGGAELDGRLAEPDAASPCIAVGDDDAAVILYTSGSTGRPKGVVLSHAAYLWTIRTRIQASNYAPERFLVAAPLYHMNALNTAMLALASGATIILMPRYSAPAYMRAIADHRCTWLTAIPTMISMLHTHKEEAESLDLSCVRMVRLGSEPLTQRAIDCARELFPTASVGNGYGTTEVGSVIFGPHPDGLPTPPLSMGYPHPAVQLRLMQNGDPDAAEGELQVKSPAVMLGYYGLPEQTSAVMTEDGYYITRDIVRRDENGFHYFVGRSDDMFVCGGENIYPGDVERMLERHPDIAQACVVPLPDALKGNKPVALIVKRAGATLDAEQVKAYALRHGPAYQHPRAVCFLDRLPVSGTEKTDRKAVAALAARLCGPAAIA